MANMKYKYLPVSVFDMEKVGRKVYVEDKNTQVNQVVQHIVHFLHKLQNGVWNIF